jgi:hypothetical protein
MSVKEFLALLSSKGLYDACNKDLEYSGIHTVYGYVYNTYSDIKHDLELLKIRDELLSKLKESIKLIEGATDGM